MLPWNLELQPRVFVELSHELARERKISAGERVKVRSSRGELECTAVVTHRLKPLNILGQTVHQVGIPFHFGWRWPDSGSEESVNVLVTTVTDPVAEIPEFKAFMVNLSKLS